MVAIFLVFLKGSVDLKTKKSVDGEGTQKQYKIIYMIFRMMFPDEKCCRKPGMKSFKEAAQNSSGEQHVVITQLE